MEYSLTAAIAEKRYSEQDFIIRLLDDATGRIEVECCKAHREVSGKWQLEVDGVRHSFGRFLIRDMASGECREFLLSVEVPDMPWGSADRLIVSLTGGNDAVIARESFPMTPPARSLPEKAAGEFFTGVRFDVSQAIISSGKLSAVIDAGGMRELRINGEKLLAGGPRLALFRAGMVPEKLRTLKLDRLKVAPDRFVSDGKSVECHALALPSLMEIDELEFTQRFTPQEDGAIRYDAEFVVPESFAGVPRLGVLFRLPGMMSEVDYLGNGPHENYPGDRSAVFSRYSANVNQLYPAYSPAVSGGSRSGTLRLSLSDRDGIRTLQITGGREFTFSALPFSEFAIEDAAAAGKEPVCESDIFLHIDCRIGEKCPVKAGVYRMTLFLKGFLAR